MKPSMIFLLKACLASAAVLMFGHGRAAEPVAAFVVYPEFVNAITNAQGNPATANSLAIYSGSHGAYSIPGSGLPGVVPSATNGADVVRLAHSGFGQTFARTVPYPNFELAVIANAQLWLYPSPNLTTREQIAGSTNAFRYKELLYKQGTNGRVRVEFETIATLFGDAERQRARNGIEEMRQALKYAPLNRQLRNALLDAYYDYMVAEAQDIKNDLAQIAQYRLGLIVVPPTEFIIDKEIQGYTNVLRKYDGILREYGKLLADPAGIDVSQIDSSASAGMNLGAYIFQREQPFRNQMAAQFRDTNGLLTTVSAAGLTNEVLFAGYKDFVALLGVLRDYAQSTAELAKLYGMRGRSATQPGQKDDRALGFELIDAANSEVQLNISFLRSLLPGAVPPDRGSDAAGVLSALAGVQTATAELSKVGSFLGGQVNALGFDPNFLVLINTFVTSDQQHLWDSYDALRGWIDFGQTTSILRRSRDLFNEAQVKHETYRGYADQVFNEMDANADHYTARYRAITGYLPEEAPDPFPAVISTNRFPPANATTIASHINNPRAGSELRQVHQSIEQSNDKERELVEIGENLQIQLTNSWARLADSHQRANVINNATKSYQDVIHTERDTITYWSARQAGMQAAYDMVSDLANVSASTPYGVLFTAGPIAAMGAANIAIQTIGEERKGDAEKQLQLAAADFDKNLAMADTDQIIFQAAEEVRNLEREKAAHALTRKDHGFLRTQDFDKTDALLRELEQAIAFRDQNDSELSARHYADPIYFLRAQNAMIRADFAFREAQRWLFFTLRALEYKYNKPFVFTSGGSTWELSSLFKLRNYNELEDLLSAVDQYNLVNLNTINGRTPFTDKISLKDDLWGRSASNVAARLGVFQARLREGLKTNSGIYEIKLNLFALAGELESGFLFRGAEYDQSNGQLQSAGFYLDKIDWIKIRFVDSTVSSETPKTGNLSYGGTSYVRPFCASLVDEGVERPNELRSFPFRFFVIQTDAGGALKVNSFPEQQATARISFFNAPGEPGAGYENDFWRERSVASTDLTLTIPASSVNPNALQDIEIYIKHRFAIRISCQP